jgi:ankyrin repeat protein
MWAATKKHMTVVKLLVENGATLLKSKGDGMNILHVAASHNDIHMLDYAIKVIEAQ